MNAPVVVFVYNRPEHTKKTIEALAENHLAKETEVFIFSDSAKNEKAFENVDATRKFIESIPDKELFKSVEIIKATKNKGLANSVIDGVTKIIGKFGKVIVVEDDLVSSKDFLQYMNEALEYYRNNNSIWSISGFNIPIDIPTEYHHDVYLSYRGCSWGWATWQDRWNQVDWNVSDYPEFKKNRKMRNNLNRGGKDMAFMLDDQMKGRIDSWAIRWCYTQSKLEMFTVYPVVSKIKNIGLDGSGTHSGISSRYDTDLTIKKNFRLSEVEPNRDILKKFSKHYMSNTGYFLRKIKRFLF